jgi:GTP cyclohydrolase II
MPSQPDSGDNGIFGDKSVMRCERAAAELRAGRPVLLRMHDLTLAVVSLDTATPQTYRAFATAFGGRVDLFITAARATALGLDAPAGCLAPLGGYDYEAACDLAYSPGQSRPVKWQAGTSAALQASRLARLSLLLPTVIVGNIAAARMDLGPALEVEEGDLDRAWLAAGQSFEIVGRSHVPLAGVGEAEFIVFRGGLAQRDQLAILVGNPDLAGIVPVRVHSSCITGDLFGSLKCDCGDQLRQALVALHDRGGGIILYLDQEGRGTGLGAKMRAYGYQEAGHDTFDADGELGFGPDERRYDTAVAMLKLLGVSRIGLLTNNPSKVSALRAGGIEVTERLPLFGEVTTQNLRYIRTKADRGGHLIPDDLESIR